MSKYFKSSEFACRDGCGDDKMDPRFVDLLDEMREMMGVPMIVRSGKRCPAHNRKEGGKDNSAHLRGLAVDIACPTSLYRYYLLEFARECGIKRIGIGSTFVHLDIDENLPSPRVWVY